MNFDIQHLNWGNDIPSLPEDLMPGLQPASYSVSLAFAFSGKNMSLGPNNLAFRCLNPRDPCEQALSGDVLFDHFEDTSRRGLETDGYYELTV